MIYEKLSKIQNELKAPKNQMNKFGGYAYRSAEDILEALKPLLKKHGCVMVISDELKTESVPSKDGNDARFYVKAHARLIDIEDGSEVVSVALAREEKEKKGTDGAQITGSASSYARKYALNGLFLIDDCKDPDSQESKTYKNGKTTVQARETVSKGSDELHGAKARLARAIDSWAAHKGVDAAKAKAGITKRPDYEANNPEFFIRAAEEFESDLTEMVANG